MAKKTLKVDKKSIKRHIISTLVSMDKYDYSNVAVDDMLDKALDVPVDPSIFNLIKVTIDEDNRATPHDDILLQDLYTANITPMAIKLYEGKRVNIDKFIKTLTNRLRRGTPISV